LMSSQKVKTELTNCGCHLTNLWSNTRKSYLKLENVPGRNILKLIQVWALGGRGLNKICPEIERPVFKWSLSSQLQSLLYHGPRGHTDWSQLHVASKLDNR
jgi:hypothetical protein